MVESKKKKAKPSNTKLIEQNAADIAEAEKQHEQIMKELDSQLSKKIADIQVRKITFNLARRKNTKRLKTKHSVFH